MLAYRVFLKRIQYRIAILCDGGCLDVACAALRTAASIDRIVIEKRASFPLVFRGEGVLRTG